MPGWINYKELKQEIAFVDVLEHYHVPYKIKGEQAKATCPLPEHESDGKAHSLSIHLGRNIFQCFGCGAKGNVLDFIAIIEGLDPKDGKSFRKAARLAQERFCYKDNRSASSRSPKPPIDGKQMVLVNPPLDFSLKGLDAKHPFFAEHGLEPRTVAHFGLGYCSRGYLKGRIAIPLHDGDGQLIGYAGRIVDESKIDEKTPKYRFPGNRELEGVKIEFDPTAFLYNAYRLSPQRGRVWGYPGGHVLSFKMWSYQWVYTQNFQLCIHGADNASDSASPATRWPKGLILQRIGVTEHQ